VGWGEFVPLPHQSNPSVVHLPLIQFIRYRGWTMTRATWSKIIVSYIELGFDNVVQALLSMGRKKSRWRLFEVSVVDLG
jgi:hypothetical protein